MKFLLAILLMVGTSLQAITPAEQWWLDRGGMKKWCDWAPMAQYQDFKYPDIKVRLQSTTGGFVNGVPTWEAWLTPWGDADFDGPVPPETVKMWYTIETAFRNGCWRMQ